MFPFFLPDPQKSNVSLSGITYPLKVFSSCICPVAAHCLPANKQKTKVNSDRGDYAWHVAGYRPLQQTVSTE